MKLEGSRRWRRRGRMKRWMKAKEDGLGRGGGRARLLPVSTMSSTNEDNLPFNRKKPGAGPALLLF